MVSTRVPATLALASISGTAAVAATDAGKLADLAVLDKDPCEVGVKGLRDIKVWGTEFEGRPHPAQGSTPGN